MMMLNGLAAWTGFLCALVGLVALPLALFAAGSGHPGWAMVAAAVLLGVSGSASVSSPLSCTTTTDTTTAPRACS